MELGVSCMLRYEYEAVYVSILCASFEVLTAMLMKTEVVWDVMPCQLVNGSHH